MVGNGTDPPCVTSGEWHVGVYLADHQGNHIDYTPARLKAASLPDQLAVTSTPPGDIVQLGVSGSSASGVDHTITLNFSSAVKTVNEKTLTVYDRTKQPGAFTSPLTISAISCSDGTSIVACDGSDGLATSATLTVPQLVVGRPYGIYANQDSVTPQLSDAADNPLGWDGAVTSVRPS